MRGATAVKQQGTPDEFVRARIFGTQFNTGTARGLCAGSPDGVEFRAPCGVLLRLMLKVRSCRVTSQRRIWWLRDHSLSSENCEFSGENDVSCVWSQKAKSTLARTSIKRRQGFERYAGDCCVYRRAGPREVWMERPR